MFLMASFFVLLILSPTTTGAVSECKMFVSSFHGINDKSCWTGGYQTPCASFDLALQATTHGNCSSSSIIYLYPGDYTLDLDTTTTREKHNNVKDVSIRVLESPSLLENECHLDMDVEVLYNMLKCPPICGLQFTASVTDCNGATLEWKNDLYVCVTTPNNLFCHNVSCPEMLIELPVMANVMIFIFHNDIHDSFNSIHGVQLMLSWQQWL